VNSHTLQGHGSSNSNRQEGTMSWRTIFTLVVSTLWVSIASAQSPYPDRPIDLRITGELLAEQQERDDLAVVDIFVRGNPLLLRVGKVEELTTQERSQVIKYEVLLHKVRFSGAESLMEYLQKPETRGKVLTIEGWLDPRERRFQVTSIGVTDGTTTTILYGNGPSLPDSKK
jgi:hypothetical protein